jgi:DNA modification methylase
MKNVFDTINKTQNNFKNYTVKDIEICGNCFKTNNLLIHGDCISVCDYLLNNGIKVDLVYIDPPFCSGKNYGKKMRIRRNPLGHNKENTKYLLDYVLYGDKKTKEEYLQWMYDNLMAIKSIMSDNASIYVHLDHHICHYVKILLDEIFGEENFVNEIIWSYRSGGASKSEALPQKHDVIFLYKNGDENVINNKIERQYLDKPFMDTKIDKDGKYYVDTILRDVLEGTPFIINKDKIEQYNMRPVLNLSKERLDYATQKPEGLLKILIEIASNEGMVIADFFGGSGVTAKVANDLKRNFISCDIGINSIQTTRDRLVSKNAPFLIKEIDNGTLEKHKKIDDIEVEISFNEANFISPYTIKIKSIKDTDLRNRIETYNKRHIASPIKISNEGLELISFVSLDCSNYNGVWVSDEEIKISKDGYTMVNGKETKTFWNGTILSFDEPLRIKVRDIIGNEIIYILKKING